MVSDVPVDVFCPEVSDSSLVAAILQRHMGEQIHTFTIGFNEERFNAARMRRGGCTAGTHHAERRLERDGACRIATQAGVRSTIENSADASGIPMLLVSTIVSEQVKVVLSADGGDELFCGYSVYPNAIRHLRARARIPEGLLVLGGGRKPGPAPGDSKHGLRGHSGRPSFGMPSAERLTRRRQADRRLSRCVRIGSDSVSRHPRLQVECARSANREQRRTHAV